jgi:outer membrane protein OmpA-like peptidoglycan-associated protein
VKTTLPYLFAYAGLPILCAACGAAGPSQELKSARDAYATVNQSGAAQVNPDGAREAQQALEVAEEAHREDAGSEQERSAAYVAERKSQMALAQADEARAREDLEKAQLAYQAKLEQELSSAHQQLQATQAASDKASKEQMGWRKKGEDLVITLSGVMFETGGHELSADAKQRLDVVTHALKQSPERGVMIAGYTDDTGRADSNRALSQKRADAVKAYLAGQGVAASRIQSVGRGEDSPVASNDTAEGRAENRRVEITLTRAGELPERQPVKGTDSEPAGLGTPK